MDDFQDFWAAAGENFGILGAIVNGESLHNELGGGQPGCEGNGKGGSPKILGGKARRRRKFLAILDL